MEVNCVYGGNMRRQHMMQVVTESFISNRVLYLSLREAGHTRHAELQFERFRNINQFLHPRRCDLVVVEPHERNSFCSMACHFLQQLANRRQVGVPQITIYASRGRKERTDE